MSAETQGLLMLSIIVTIGVACLLASIAAIIRSRRAMRREHVIFNIVRITDDRRTAELLGKLAAAHQDKADADLEAFYNSRVRVNRERRKAVRARMRLIHGVPTLNVQRGH